MKAQNCMVHRYIGILVGFLLAILGLTGSALVFHEEINHFLYPQLMHVEPQGKTISLQKVSDIVLQYPDYKLQAIALSRKADEPFHTIVRSQKSLSDVYINPYNGEILGTIVRDGQRWVFDHRALMEIIEQVHTSFLAGEPGKFLVGICGILLIIRAISGLIIFPGWKKLSAGFKIRWKAPSHLLHYDFHKIIGIFVVVFLILAGTTGTLMEFNQPVRSLGYLLSGTPQPAKPVSVPNNNTQSPTLDQFLEIAEATLPGGETTYIFPALDQKAAVRVRKRLENDIHPNGRSFVYLNQYSGEVLRVENINYAPWVEKLLAWMYPLHIGSYGGVKMRFLYVLLGIAPAILLITGIVIFWNKTYGATTKRKDA
jgi:uncharacterized iron-regulated membrane protein